MLAEAGLAEHFVHRIGLPVHEEPYIVNGNDLPLTVGMAFSVELGIYFPGCWGERDCYTISDSDNSADTARQRYTPEVIPRRGRAEQKTLALASPGPQ